MSQSPLSHGGAMLALALLALLTAAPAVEAAYLTGAPVPTVARDGSAYVLAYYDCPVVTFGEPKPCSEARPVARTPDLFVPVVAADFHLCTPVLESGAWVCERYVVQVPPQDVLALLP